MASLEPRTGWRDWRVRSSLYVRLVSMFPDLWLTPRLNPEKSWHGPVGLRRRGRRNYQFPLSVAWRKKSRPMTGYPREPQEASRGIAR